MEAEVDDIGFDTQGFGLPAGAEGEGLVEAAVDEIGLPCRVQGLPTEGRGRALWRPKSMRRMSADAARGCVSITLSRWRSRWMMLSR